MNSKILRYTFYIMSLIPLTVLYGVGDLIVLPILYWGIKYRRKAVRGNLEKCFPKLTARALEDLELRFYKSFVSQMMEMIKLHSLSVRQMQKRMVFENVELINDLTHSDRSILLMLGHYGNWEFIPSLKLWIEPGIVGGQVYRRLKNNAFDELFLHLRQRFGTVCIEKNDIFREIIKYRKKDQKLVIGFMSDQAPSLNNQNYWTTFLGQETAILTGVERIATRMDLSVIYLDVECTSRGHYKGTFKLIAETPKACAENEITERYARLMEQTILRAPEHYLWTHKRWKHQRPEPTNTPSENG